MRCAFCSSATASSREHIVLDAFGGKRRVRGVSCVNCNNRLGEEIDKPFAEAFRETRILLGHRSGVERKMPGPKRGLRSKTGQRVTLAADGVLEVEIEKPMNAVPSADGGLSVSVEGRNEAELACLIVNALSMTTLIEGPRPGPDQVS